MLNKTNLYLLQLLIDDRLYDYQILRYRHTKDGVANFSSLTYKGEFVNIPLNEFPEHRGQIKIKGVVKDFVQIVSVY